LYIGYKVHYIRVLTHIKRPYLAKVDIPKYFIRHLFFKNQGFPVSK